VLRSNAQISFSGSTLPAALRWNG